MTAITTSPHLSDTHPATVPGGFSHDRLPPADAPHDSPPSTVDCGRAAPFLTTPTTDEQKPAPQTSARDEAAMRRLRHPFAVAESVVR